MGTQPMESSCLVVSCTVEMLLHLMLRLPWLLSRTSVLFNSLIGVQLDSKPVSTLNHHTKFQKETSPRQNVHVVWLPTTLLSQKLSPVSITSSILCTQSVLSFTGMLVKVWKKVNSPKLVRTLLLLKRIMKRLLWTLKKMVKKELKKNTKNLLYFCCVYDDVWWKVYGKSFF